MKLLSAHSAGVVVVGLLTVGSYSTAWAADHNHGHDDHGHDHDHAHDHGQDKNIDAGYFDDDQVEDRQLSDWEGDWQSVYPYLQDGTLDPVFAHKAAHGDKTAAEYKAYYEKGYQTDVSRIVIDGDDVTFYEGDEAHTGEYVYDGHEILTYEAGNRGVRYIFEREGGDEEAPKYFQFSDHAIAPNDADHYHLYMGDDRQALLEEVTNWPTYYPSDLSGEEVAEEMMAH
ncbi:metal-binding protein ZinT [Salinicola acroporae]|uniref:Metal-binding protein ZinT n=1 Tax=Salinicola acroporae TaxID=1541440 RepID=A0ABT6I861_9GAMM|nr:metal-binding protein ZinT [Salinicola acroporae]MDH4573888.1 metal-binding protein ZinT [Salinicola acroporae]